MPPTVHERFTEGDCHILALELNKLSGWPLATFVYDDERYKSKADLHAFVLHPSGDVVDIEGRQTEEDFRAKWSDTQKIKTWDGIEELEAAGWWTPAMWKGSAKVARKLAPEIVEAAR